MQTIARDFKVVIPVSYYERVGETTFNTVAVIDADGTIMVSTARPTFRMTILSGKFYFTPGNTGFKVWDTLMRKSASVSAGTSVPGVRALHGAARRGTAVLPDCHRFRADS